MSIPNPVPYEEYQELLAKTNSLEVQALHREGEIHNFKGMLAQKDEEMVRLKDQLHLRDTTVSKLRALIEFAWAEFDSATWAHVSSIQGEPHPLLSTFNGPQPPPTEAKIPREVPNPLTKEAKQDDKPFASAPIFYGGPILSVSKSKGRPPPPPRPRPLRPPPSMEADIVGAAPTPPSPQSHPPRPPPSMEADILGAAPTPPPPRSHPPRPPPPMKANIRGAAPTPPPPRPRPPPHIEANITGATQTHLRRYPPNNTKTMPRSSRIRVAQQDGKPPVSAPIASAVKP